MIPRAPPEAAGKAARQREVNMKTQIGLAALLAMLRGCAPGVTVVNIDNGFGAAYSAHLINKGMAEA